MIDVERNLGCEIHSVHIAVVLVAGGYDGYMYQVVVEICGWIVRKRCRVLWRHSVLEWLRMWMHRVMYIHWIEPVCRRRHVC